MNYYFLIFVFINTSLFSQKDWNQQSYEWNKRSGNTDKLIKGISLGFLIQGQTKYPDPYLGPEINSKFNDGAYHFFIDLYIRKLIVGFQISDEYLYLEKIEDDGSVWKPRGFNNRFSSLTRSFWFSLGYRVWDKLYLKSSLGLRSGPQKSLFNSNKTAEEVANGFDFKDTSLFYNSSSSLIEKISETDVLVSLSYPIAILGDFNIVPELGYSINYGGITIGSSILYYFK